MMSEISIVFLSSLILPMMPLKPEATVACGGADPAACSASKSSFRPFSTCTSEVWRNVCANLRSCRQHSASSSSTTSVRGVHCHRVVAQRRVTCRPTDCISSMAACGSPSTSCVFSRASCPNAEVKRPIETLTLSSSPRSQSYVVPLLPCLRVRERSCRTWLWHPCQAHLFSTKFRGFDCLHHSFARDDVNRCLWRRLRNGFRRVARFLFICPLSRPARHDEV